LPWQRPLDNRSRLCLRRIAWPRKPTPRIKQRVASYHATTIIARRKSKTGCHGNVPYHLCTTSNTWFLGHIRAHYPNGISIGSAIFAQMTVCVRILHNGTPLPPKIAPFHMGIWTPSKTWFSGPTRVLNANGISIGSAVLQGSLCVTDWQTDRPTDHATRSVTTYRIYVHSTAMRPNKYNHG